MVWTGQVDTSADNAILKIDFYHVLFTREIAPLQLQFFFFVGKALKRANGSVCVPSVDSVKQMSVGKEQGVL